MANALMIRPLPLVDVASATADAGHLPAYVGNDYAGVTWKASAASYRALTVDLGSDQVVDTVMAFGLTNRASAALGVNIWRKADGAGSFTLVASGLPLFAGDAPMTSGLGVGFYPLPSEVTARYLLIEFPSAYDGALELSRLVVGKKIQLERNFGFGGTFGVRDLGSVDFSRRGVLMRSRGKKLRTVGLTFSNISKDEVEATTKPLLEQIGNTEMIALVTDSDAHVQRRNRCYFGPLVGDLGHTQRNARGWEAKVNIVSIF